MIIINDSLLSLIFFIYFLKNKLLTTGKIIIVSDIKVILDQCPLKNLLVHIPLKRIL